MLVEPRAMTEYELIDEMAMEMAPEMTDKPWECECTKKRGTNCDCGDAMNEERVDRYDEDLCRDDLRRYARAALRAIRKAGCEVAPREPTEKMLEAGYPCFAGVACGDLALDIAGDAYRAMLSASPLKGET
jgi:hypothetical protein